MSGQQQFSFTIPSAVDAAAGEAAKSDGMAAADANTPAGWAAECDAAIRTLAARGEPFQAADLVAQGLVGEPDHPNRWGARFGAAARAGVIETAGVVQSKRATVHRSLCRQWVGTQITRAAA